MSRPESAWRHAVHDRTMQVVHKLRIILQTPRKISVESLQRRIWNAHLPIERKTPPRGLFYMRFGKEPSDI
jgi:hypothetical protein